MRQCRACASYSEVLFRLLDLLRLAEELFFKVSGLSLAPGPRALDISQYDGCTIGISHAHHLTYAL